MILKPTLDVHNRDIVARQESEGIKLPLRE